MSTRETKPALPGFAPDFAGERFCVAFSGGLDSTFLLYSFAERRARQPSVRLRAIHVNHHLLPEAYRWAEHCRAVAAKLGVELEVVDVQVALGPGVSPEAAARDARYAALEERIEDGEILVTGHHQDDQLETVLLQLLRGAGVAGLAAMPGDMPFGRGRHQRPLIALSRDDIEKAALAVGLTWIEDTSNQSLQYDRNYLRQRVLPLLRERWPAAAANVSRTAEHMAVAQMLLEDLARIDQGAASEDNSLDLAVLRALSPTRARNLLRHWIRRAGFRAPSTVKLGEILRQMTESRPDSHPRVEWDGVEISRRRGRLYLKK